MTFFFRKIFGFIWLNIFAVLRRYFFVASLEFRGAVLAGLV